MVARRGGVDRSSVAKETYLTNKTAVTEILRVNPTELPGKYDYYSSGSRSADAYTCIWEKNNERIVLYGANDISNTGGFMYVSIPLWQEYENNIIKRQNDQNAAKESAQHNF